MVLQLPHDLITLIIDFIAYDPDSLKTCSVLDRYWMEETRRHIFENLVLTIKVRRLRRGGYQARLDGLTECFFRDPQAANSVRTICIQQITFAFDNFPFVRDKVTLLLSHLSNVHHFSFRNFQWSMAGPRLHHSIHQLFERNPLRRITTDQFAIGDLAAIKLLQCARTLEALELQGAQIFRHADETARAGVKLNELKSLHISNRDLRHVYPGIIHAENFAALSNLVIANQSIPSTDFDIIKKILDLPLPSLRRLRLHKLPTSMHDIRIPHDLTEFIVHHCDLPTLAHILGHQNHATSLQRLYVTAFALRVAQVPPSSFRELDKSLHRMEFSQLESLTIRISSYDSEEMTELLQKDELFPLLSSTDRVRVSVSHTQV